MSDPIPTIESIVGMRPEPIKNEPTPRQILDGGARESWLKFLGIRPTAETHNVLVDIATQLRIANQIAYATAHPGWVDIPTAREQIEKELFS